MVDALCQTRLGCFGHAERMDIENSVIIGSLKLMAREGEVDHVKYGLS